MTAIAPLYFDHELRVQQSDVDAKYMAHCGFNKTESLGAPVTEAVYYEVYFYSGWHLTADLAKTELREKLTLAGWGSPE